MLESAKIRSGDGHGWRFAEFHVFGHLGRQLVVDVRRGRVFELDEPATDFLTAGVAGASVSVAATDVRRKWGWRRLLRVWHALQQQGLLTRQPPPRPEPPEPRLLPVTSLDLNVTHQCNLACRYCYGAYGTLLTRTDGPFRYGSTEGWMTPEVARAAFSFLLKQSGDEPEISLIFFGGEPLLNWRLIETMVPEFRRRAEEAKKKLSLSTATNATLLTPRKLDFLVRNGIGIQFSIDGPAEVQDDQRCDRLGRGSHASVAEAAQRLFRARPRSVNARATITRRHLDLPAIVDALLAMGFGSVHVEPATGIRNDYGLTEADLPELKRQYTNLAEMFLARLRDGRLFNLSNFVKYVRNTHAPQAPRFHPCGAGRSYLCVAPDGRIYLCHRFTGSDEYSMGDAFEGLRDDLRRRIAVAHVDARPGCRDCWARYYCGGGCWRVNVDATGSLEEPDRAFQCVLIRHVVELSMAINAHLADEEAEILAAEYERDRLPHEN
jgi:uncharacterized protein